MLDGRISHGHIELHRQASDWYKHKHHQKAAYDTVILHVVWDNDCKIQRKDSTEVPTLALKDRVPPQLIKNYKAFTSNQTEILCAQHFSKVDKIVQAAMLDKALFRRLMDKH